MTIDPQCQALIDFVNQTGGTPFNADDYQAARDAYRDTIAVYTHATPELANVRDQNIVVDGGADGSDLGDNEIPIRIYRPRSDKTSLPALVFFHGGGWVVGDLDTHDHVCRYLAGHAEISIISVDYRLAPEHPFPAPFEDCLQALIWTFNNASNLQIDINRIAVGGDSAGGNLAAAVSLALRESPKFTLAYQLLIYPACDFTAQHPSMQENGDGYLLTVDAMQRFTEWYIPSEAQRRDPRASPQLASSHQGLPPTYIITAGFDPLRDEGQIYAKTLSAAGVETEHICYDGMVHGFLRMGGKLDVAIDALNTTALVLKQNLHC